MATNQGDQRPDILLITCDQLSFEALGCYGNEFIRTPNIDRLAGEGVRLEHHFVQNPLCQPSRASLVTGRYPQAHGVKYNWYDLPSSEETLQKVLGRRGYTTAAVGKMHFEPNEEKHDFDQRVFVEGKMFTGNDEYRSYLRNLGKVDEFQEHISRWNDESAFGAVTSPIPDEQYIDTFIGAKAADVLARLKTPSFLWASFVNPHMPVDPPPPFDSMYDPAEIPLPLDWQHPQVSRYPEHRLASAGRSFDGITEEKLRAVRANYFGVVSLVDREVGKLIRVLEESGRLDRTVVIFTTDHGDFLGHRGMLWKGGRMLYDQLLRVPLIVRYPVELPGGVVVSHLSEGVDLMPTLLDYAGAPCPPGVQGRTLRPILRQGSVENWRSTVFSEAMDVKMVRDYDWKLIFYPGRPYGELYHVRTDPLELNNLYDDPLHERRRGQMVEKLAERLVAAEDPLPLPTSRSGYFEASGFHSEQELSGHIA